MDINKYRRAFAQQKAGAASRGIGFHLTFQEWCEFWGEDIDRRGSGPDNLQMQRPADTGPYAVWNIRKGTPKQNAVTRGHMERKRASDQAAVELQIALDAAMNDSSEPELDERENEFDQRRLGIKSSYLGRYYHRG